MLVRVAGAAGGGDRIGDIAVGGNGDRGSHGMVGVFVLLR